MKSTKAVFICLFLALALRLFALFTVDSIQHPYVWEYETIANNILNGKGIQYTFLETTYRNTTMVLYPLISASIYYFTNHSFLAIKIFQILLSLLTCILIYLLSRKIFQSNKIALFSLMLLVFHPGLIVYSVKLHPLTLESFLLALTLLFLVSVMSRATPTIKLFFTGLSLGLMLLVRATAGLFIPVAFLILYFKLKKAGTSPFLSIGSILLGVCLILTPLIVRNFLIYKKVVILPNDSGFNFWIGNNRLSNGTADSANGKSVFYSTEEAFRNKVYSLNEFGQKKFLYDDAFNFIKNDKIRALQLFFKKIYFYWWFSPDQGHLYPAQWALVYKLYYSIIIFFAISPFFVMPKKLFIQNKESIYLIISCFIAMSLAQSLYYVDGRHRWTIEPVILIFSGCGAVFLTEKLNNIIKA